MSWRLLTGDCLDVLPTLEPDSIDACTTDPPYGIGFLGRERDTFKPHTVEAMRQRTVKDRRHVDNPNLHGRRAWTAGASVEYDRSAAASLKFHAWTQQWAEAVLRVLKPGAHAVVCASPPSPVASCLTPLLARARPGWPASKNSVAFSASSAKRSMSRLPTRACMPSMSASRPGARCLWTWRSRDEKTERT